MHKFNFYFAFKPRLMNQENVKNKEDRFNFINSKI